MNGLTLLDCIFLWIVWRSLRVHIILKGLTFSRFFYPPLLLLMFFFIIGKRTFISYNISDVCILKSSYMSEYIQVIFQSHYVTYRDWFCGYTYAFTLLPVNVLGRFKLKRRNVYNVNFTIICHNEINNNTWYPKHSKDTFKDPTQRFIWHLWSDVNILFSIM